MESKPKQLFVCTKKLKYIEFITLRNEIIKYIKNKPVGTGINTKISEVFNDFNDKYTTNDYKVDSLQALNTYYSDNETQINKHIKTVPIDSRVEDPAPPSTTGSPSTTATLSTTGSPNTKLDLNENSLNLRKLEEKINNKLIKFNENSTRAKTLVTMILIIIGAVIGLLIFIKIIKIIRNKSRINFSEWFINLGPTKIINLYNEQNQINSPIVSNLNSHNENILQNEKILQNDEKTRSIIASVIAILFTSISVGGFKSLGITPFNNMIWIQMLFGNILGFILDQLIAKREGLVTLNNLKRWLSSEKQNVVNYDPNNKKYNITGAGNPSRRIFDGLNELLGIKPTTTMTVDSSGLLDSRDKRVWSSSMGDAAPDLVTVGGANPKDTIRLNMSNYLSHKILSKEFIRFMITVLIDICISSFIVNMLKNWAREYNLLPKCYTSTLCGNPDNLTPTEVKNKKDNKRSNEFLDILINIFVGLITFYLYVNRIRLNWAYKSNDIISEPIHFAIIVFGVAAVNIYANQPSGHNPMFFQKINGKRILVLLLFILFLANDYGPGSDVIDKFIRKGSNIRLFKFICVLIPICIIVAPLIGAYNSLSQKNTSSSKCHHDIYKSVRQQQSEITHFHHNDQHDQNDLIDPQAND